MTFLVRSLAPREVADAVELLRAAANWTARFGSPIWNEEELAAALSDRSGEEGGWFGGFEQGRLSACMRVDGADPVHWPNDPPGAAIYVHKVAVARRAAGRGWTARLIAHAVDLAASRGAAFVRLDTAPRKKLINLYRQLGFELTDPRPQVFAGRELVKLERAIRR
jgi:GNAT superfamily N-acetyltransferase